MPDADFDPDSDGGLYVSILETTKDGAFIQNMMGSKDTQVNRINYVYKITAPSSPFYLGIGFINRSTSTRPTQDRVTMHISPVESFVAEQTFSIRYE